MRLLSRAERRIDANLTEVRATISTGNILCDHCATNAAQTFAIDSEITALCFPCYPMWKDERLSQHYRLFGPFAS